MKTCAKCGETKELTEYYKGNTKCGLKSACKKCTTRMTMAHRKKNWDKCLEYAREYRKRGNEKFVAAEKLRYQKTKVEMRLRLNRYKMENKELFKYTARLRRLASKRIKEYSENKASPYPFL